MSCSNNNIFPDIIGKDLTELELAAIGGYYIEPDDDTEPVEPVGLDGRYLRYDAPQDLTPEQQQQAQDNLFL